MDPVSSAGPDASRKSDDVQSRGRKNLSAVLRALAETSQARAAQAMGVSESTVSRMKGGELETFCALLAACGLKPVPITHRCVAPETFAAFALLWDRAMQITTPARLVFEDTEQ